jgi:hypothetical protein
LFALIYHYITGALPTDRARNKAAIKKHLRIARKARSQFEREAVLGVLRAEWERRGEQAFCDWLMGSYGDQTWCKWDVSASGIPGATPTQQAVESFNRRIKALLDCLHNDLYEALTAVLPDLTAPAVVGVREGQAEGTHPVFGPGNGIAMTESQRANAGDYVQHPMPIHTTAPGKCTMLYDGIGTGPWHAMLYGSICQGTSYLEASGWKTELMQGAVNRYELAVNTSGGGVTALGRQSDSADLVEQYAKEVMELHKVELLTAEGTKGPELKCDFSGFWEHAVCSHIWVVVEVGGC